ncbi:hypothetical protein H2200_000767 [Cladophialophora chaetospira]|uniref:NmrA-like domain-containing protein n=1 Tax=Cladophialophora chaetospira TaxID=386627 RepID=A0AA38XPX6_9EURO|nr:hypothetical protein H2200_000767 [Cladophialophora chaetospira]
MPQPQTDLPPRTRSILVIGAGELGLAIINAILSHQAYSPHTTILTLMIRPTSLTQPSPSKAKQNEHIRSLGVAIVAGDIESLSQSDLSSLLREGNYTAVLHAGGMTLAPGSMLKLTRATITAEIPYYVPWQHGVDYDTIGRQGGQGMFSEQIDVRDLLRSQRTTDWIVLSCGIFMSFLFEEFWGVVKRLPPDEDGGKEKVQVTALNSWDDVLTVTSAEDIGTCTAALLFRTDAPVNEPVYIAGDTLPYGEFADTIARVLEPKGIEVVRQVWSLRYLKEESEKDPEDKLKRYRVVFSEGRGLSWRKEGTWSAKQGVEMTGVEDWVKRNWA